MLQRIVRWGQWFAIILLPGWLFLGSALLASGGGWLVFVLLLAVPVLAVLLLVGPLISLAIPRGYRSAITATWAVLNIALWAVVLLIPLALQEEGDGPVGPSFFERLGMPSVVDEAIFGALWVAIPVLLLGIWASSIVAVASGRRARYRNRSAAITSTTNEGSIASTSAISDSVS